MFVVKFYKLIGYIIYGIVGRIIIIDFYKLTGAN